MVSDGGTNRSFRKLKKLQKYHFSRFIHQLTKSKLEMPVQKNWARLCATVRKLEI